MVLGDYYDMDLRFWSGMVEGKNLIIFPYLSNLNLA